MVVLKRRFSKKGFEAIWPEQGRAEQGWPGLCLWPVAWPGLAWPGLAWPGLAWPGLAWPGLAWPGLAWPGLAWPGLA